MVIVTPDSWAELKAVQGSQVTTWDTLLLDAYNLLPEVGPALVLGLAAVETAATAACSHLAGLQAPAALWAGLGRGLRVGDLLGRALTALGRQPLSADDPSLWDRFLALRTGRNSFCHEGSPHDHRGAPIFPRQAGDLVHAADDILLWLEAHLPVEHHRPRTAVTVRASLAYPLVRVGDGEEAAPVDGSAADPIGEE